MKHIETQNDDCIKTQTKLTTQIKAIEQATTFLTKADQSLLDTIRENGGDAFADALAPLADIKVVTPKDVRKDGRSSMGNMQSLVTEVVAWEKENDSQSSTILPVGHLNVEKGILSTVALFDELENARFVQSIDAIRNDWIESPWLEHVNK